MMQQALKEWRKLKTDDFSKVDSTIKRDPRYNISFPKGGLILRQTVRDLPREKQPGYDTWRHNFDHVWLTAAEAGSFVPESPTAGQSFSIPNGLATRLAKFHFVDQVKGEADAWATKEVQSASLSGQVVKVHDNIVTIHLSGKARCVASPNGAVNPYSGNRISKERGVALTISGRLSYDRSARTFRTFDILAHGSRWGTATYNARERDMGPAPIGFAFELIETKPQNMTRPKFLLWKYFEK